MSRFPGPLLRGALVTAFVTHAAASSADTPNPNQTKDGEVAIVDAEPPAENLPPKRPVPDYDGRGEKPATIADGLLWVPRIVLAPLYLFTEYLVRRPTGAIVTAIERDKLAQRVIYIGTIGPRRNIGFFPSFYFDYGRVPAAGLYIWWDEVGSPRNYVRGYVATWGEPLLTATIADRYQLDHAGTAASLRVSYTHRNDNLFFGLGPDTTSRSESRYESNTFEGGTVFEHRYIVAHTGFRNVRYGNDTCCGTPRLADVVKSGRLAAPPRFADGSYTSLFQSATFAVDTRHEIHESGVRVAVTGAPSFDVSEHPGNSWVRYQASALGAWDISGTSRTLSLGLNAIFVDPIQGGGRGIPFTELVTLGGTGPMRGYLPGRLIGRSAAVAALNYEWPIWSFIDGMIETSLGNVFGAGLKGLSADKLRLSTVFGLRSNSSRDHVFELLSGFGTETFEHGARVTSFRLALGASRAF